MGILNVTPDSFFDGGRYSNEADIVRKVNAMEYNGVNIVDIGGYSTRPGAEHISEDQELKRVIPIVSLIKSNFPNLIISVDTFRAKVAKNAIEVGADMINDISGGTLDDQLFEVIAEFKAPYVLMHIKGTPKNMQTNPTYSNVVEEVKEYFSKKIEQLKKLGVSDIILDPGFGFGKTVEHNYELLKNLDVFKSFDLPILAGISRKSMINKVINTTPEEALNGTTTLNTVALMNGANILRVHDVKEAKETIKLIKKLK